MAKGVVPLHRKVNEKQLSDSVNAQQFLTDPSLTVLCTLEAHNNSVNTVRFSPDGTMIAASSDDSRVSVHVLKKPVDLSAMTADEIVQRQRQLSSSGGSFWKSGNLEEWQWFTSFKEHEHDVSSVCWSPDSRRLASCGVDGKVCVYNVKEKKTVWSTGNMEKGHVKGVAWDPIGKYLAAQTDNEVLVWNTDTWEVRHRFNLLDQAVNSTCYFYRLNWTCDGSHLFVVSVFRKKKHRALVLKREDFSSPKSIVGPQDFISVAVCLSSHCNLTITEFHSLDFLLLLLC